MALSAHTTLIIAVAAGSVGGLLLLLILYRLLRRPAKPNPLPPKQELARYREHQIHVAESRPPTWYDTGSLSAPPSGTFGASKSSLLPPDSRGGSPFRRASMNTSESPSEDISHFPPMLPPLHPPSSFDTSSTSLSTSETDSPSPRASRNNRRPRPLSVGSNVSSAAVSRLSRNSRQNIRGVPHGPHSEVQIILPAPLAFNDRTSYHESARLSVVDQWAPMAVRSEGNLVLRPQPRSLSQCTQLHVPLIYRSNMSVNSGRAATVKSLPTTNKCSSRAFTTTPCGQRVCICPLTHFRHPRLSKYAGFHPAPRSPDPTTVAPSLWGCARCSARAPAR
ncbi:hypothetical protein C8R46DRAFT_1089445 [Mycena filopes]|nr:hypothetical protein C8R46DRAFT_1089445 [Mycena filopes]